MKRTISVSSNLDEVLVFWANGRDVYALEGPENGHYRFSKATAWQPGLHTLGDFRQLEPLKALFFPAREFIGRWNDQTAREPLPERIVFGVKNCDLSALGMFDHVFLHGVCPDPYFQEVSQATQITLELKLI